MAIKKWVNGNLTVIADTTKVSDDVSAGEPIIVQHRNGCYAPLSCVLDDGVLRDHLTLTVILGNGMMRWLNDTADAAYQWLAAQGHPT